MELKEYLAIFKKQRSIFFACVLASVLMGCVLFLFQPKKDVANLTLNVTRMGTQKTDAYRYDDFYRLQADERFADTAVRWLISSPRVLFDISNDAQVSGGKLSFKAERLSSQMIQVRYQVENDNVARKIANSTIKVLNLQSGELNRAQQEETWFQILGSEPVVSDARISFETFFLASLMLGIFLGFWWVLLRYYFTK